MLEENDSDFLALYSSGKEGDEVYTYKGASFGTDGSQFSRSYTEVDDNTSELGKLYVWAISVTKTVF